MRDLPPLPSIQALRILDAVVRLKSFSAAARELGLTHGAVSRQMRQLEERANAPLFTRRGAVMEPSDAAIAIAARSGHALRALGDIFESPRQRAAPKQRLRLATTSSFARFWIGPRLEAMQAAPGFDIAAIETGVEPVRLDAGKFDVAIRYGRGAWPHTDAHRLGAERTFPVASPRFARSLREWSNLDIAHAPLIANAFISWSVWLEAAGLPTTTALNVAIETRDSNFSLDAAASGAGIALARARLAEPMLARGELVRLSTIAVDDGYAYFLAWPNSSRRLAAVSALQSWLHREFTVQSAALGL